MQATEVSGERGGPWLVMADTHWPRHGRELPPWLLAAAGRATAIVHAGDLTDPALLDRLERFAPVWAVAGNGDPPDARLPATRLLRLGDLRIGLTHGHLGPTRLRTADRAVAAFAGNALDLVIFGHSHSPVLEPFPGYGWRLNPGSPTERRRAPACSAAWLDEVRGRPVVTWLGP